MHSKGNHKQDEKTTITMWENTCKQSNRQRISLQNIQTAYGVIYQKHKQSKQKWAEDLNRHISKEDT